MDAILSRIPFIKGFTLDNLPSLEQVQDRARRIASKVPFSDDVVALYFCAVDPDVPSRVKIAVVAALGYLVLPADAVPDVIVALGFTDDVAVLTAVHSLVSGHVTDDHRAKAKATLNPEHSDAPVETM